MSNSCNEASCEASDDRLLREQAQAAEEQAIQDIVHVIADRLKTDRDSWLRAYVWYRLQYPTDAGPTAALGMKRVAQELDQWIAQALDDREGMIAASQEPRS